MWLRRLFGLTESAADKASLLAMTDRFDSCTMSSARKFICAVLRRTSSSIRSSKQTIRTMMSYGENPAVMPASSIGAFSVPRNCEKCEEGRESRKGVPSYYNSVLVVVVVATELGGWHACSSCGLGAY